MRRVGAVLAVALSVVVCVAVMSPVGALSGSPSAGTGRRPITVVDIGGWASGINQLGLSERGHVVANEQVPADGSTPSRFRHIRWYRGRAVEIVAEPGRSISPSGLNDRGVVVGIDRPVDGGVGDRGFVWDGEMIPQPEDPSRWWAEAIDERGRILVNRAEGTGSRAAVRFRGREITSPDIAGGGFISGRAMNDRGLVLGGTLEPGGVPRTFVWRPGTQPVEIDVPDGSSWFSSQINDRGSVLFQASIEGVSHVVLWKNGRLVDLGTLGGPGASLLTLPFVVPDQLNDRDQVTGTSKTASGQSHAFLWSNGEMRDLGTLGGANSYGYGINDRGEVVGVSETATGTRSAFLWRDGVMTDIGAIASPTGSAAHVINDRGQVLGQRDDFYGVLWETRGRG